MALEYSYDVSLAPKTTLGVGGPARRHVVVHDLHELGEAYQSAHEAGEPVMVLGGGSNLVVSDAGFPGLVVELAFSTIALSQEGSHARVTVGAGVVWDELVDRMVTRGYAGIECLSGIPGLVGATPIQNVGAYGQEVADTITYVEAIDRQIRRPVKLRPDECGFAYRTSIFKNNDRWIVTSVEFRLEQRETSMPIKYAELAKSLGIPEGSTAPLPLVRERVIELRRGKGMVLDPADPDSKSAGSFFTNPIVDAATAAGVLARLSTDTKMPQWPADDGKVKLSAAWLIERAGFTKGYTRGRAGISNKHALALVNRGGATATELLDLAHEIQRGVRDRLGVDLHPEPVIV